MTADLFTAPENAIDEAALRAFVESALASRLQAESRVVEFKSKVNKSNVVEAVAAMSNSDGGLVFVGVDEAQPSAPLVGITVKEQEGAVQQLRAHLPDAMPEVIPVAIGQAPGRVVLLLRIDADTVDPPVVFNGRVLVRVPGQTHGARREEIERLFHRSQTGTDPRSGPAMEIGSLSLFEPDPAIEYRVHARFTLPRHVVGREWIGSDAVRAVQESLQASPVPGRLQTEHVRSHELGEVAWSLTESTAMRARYRSGPSTATYKHRQVFASTALVTLAGRTLNVAVSTSIEPSESGRRTFSVSELHELLLGGVESVVSAGTACAGAMDALLTVRPPVLTGWLGGNSGVDALELDGEWLPVGMRAAVVRQRRLESVQPDESQTEALDQVVKAWLTPLLFDLGALGFEQRLHDLSIPHWA